MQCRALFTAIVRFHLICNICLCHLAYCIPNKINTKHCYDSAIFAAKTLQKVSNIHNIDFTWEMDAVFLYFSLQAILQLIFAILPWCSTKFIQLLTENRNLGKKEWQKNEKAILIKWIVRRLYGLPCTALAVPSFIASDLMATLNFPFTSNDNQ